MKYLKFLLHCIGLIFMGVSFLFVCFIQENLDWFMIFYFMLNGLVLLPTYEMFCSKMKIVHSIKSQIKVSIGSILLPLIVFSFSPASEESIITLILSIATIFVYWYSVAIKITDTKKEDSFIFDGIKNMFQNNGMNSFETKTVVNVEVDENYAIELKEISSYSKYAIVSLLYSVSCKLNDSSTPVIDMNMIVRDIYNNIDLFSNDEDLEFLQTKDRLIKIIDENCNDFKKYILSRIKEELKSMKEKKANEFYEYCLNKYLINMDSMISAKIDTVFCLNKKQTNSEEIENTVYINSKYQEYFDYLSNCIAAAIIIARVILIDKAVDKNKNSDFIKIINNFYNDGFNVSTMIEKTYPVYMDFYVEEFKINGMLNYPVLVQLIINTCSELQQNSECVYLKETNIDVSTYKSYEDNIYEWIDKTVSINSMIDFEKAIFVLVARNSDFANLNLVVKEVKKISKYIEYYNKKLNVLKKEDIRNKYLAGDFGDDRIKNRTDYSLENIRTGTDFELYLVKLFKTLGYTVQHNGKAGDQGCDLLLEKNNYVYAIQAKFYTDKLGNTPVQEIVGALKYYNADQGVVITNSTFTQGAIDLAKVNDVILIDGKKLSYLIDRTMQNNMGRDVLKDVWYNIK